ncbi:MAG: DsbA family protein [Micavibrio aeruginosavorus]|nr:DsbA family protein [Micavibrio aeruginosavorus]
MDTKGKKPLLIALAGVVVLAGIAAFLVNTGDNKAGAPQEQAAVSAEATTAAADEAPAAAKPASASRPAEPLGERTLGNPSASVRVEEFSSLTCPHCAHFHKETFATFKEKLIDTGKVFFVFTDFPLNAPALDASMIARCMPPERYFTFIAFLYENQDKWAYDSDYKTRLRQDAKLAGMTDERFDSCLADTSLKEGLVARMQEKAGRHEIASTPSFLINGKTVVSGALSFESIEKAINDAAATPEAETTQE